MNRVRITCVAGALALCILVIPAITQASTRTGGDLGSRIALLEQQTATLNTLLANVMRSGNDLIITQGLDVEGAGNLGPNGQHIACFENTNAGAADGVAIKVDGAPLSSDNNFFTFYNDDDVVCGRIEGFSLLEGDPFSNFPSVPSIGISDFFSFCPNFITITGGSLPSISGGSLPSFDFSISDPGFSGGSWPTVSIGSFPSIDFKSPIQITNPLDAAGDVVTWLADVICWAFENDLQSLIQTDPFGLALAPLILTESTLCKNGTTGEGGVTYGSTGADYAEWLEKADPRETFLPGQVVGVLAGKISKKTDGADQIMAVSQIPAVVGNIPQPHEAERFEKVGFMGQVAVLVRGKVTAGDYIIPSGRNDGIGIALPAKELRAKHLTQILGRAWSDSTSESISSVTVAIGVKTNAGVEICARQQERIDRLREAIEALQAPSQAPAAPEENAAHLSAGARKEGGAR